jgi:AraC-like DNA-binding protein
MPNRKKPTYRVASNPVNITPGAGLTVLFAGESQTGPNHRVGPKVVDYYLLHHIVAGKGRFSDGEREVELSAGCSFLIRPGELASYVSDEADPWQYRWVAFAGDSAEALVREAGLAPPRSVVDTADNRTPGEQCRAIYRAFRDRRPSASLEASGHLLLLLADLREAAGDTGDIAVRPESHREELVQRAISLLTAQFAEPVSMEGLAETLGYSRAYLSRVFKRETGLSPLAFLNRLRLDHGRRLLRERPELTVEQIAFSVGFRDALYFSKQFRRRYGESPTAYRSRTVATGTPPSRSARKPKP